MQVFGLFLEAFFITDDSLGCQREISFVLSNLDRLGNDGNGLCVCNRETACEQATYDSFAYESGCGWVNHHDFKFNN